MQRAWLISISLHDFPQGSHNCTVIFAVKVLRPIYFTISESSAAINFMFIIAGQIGLLQKKYIQIEDVLDVARCNDQVWWEQKNYIKEIHKAKIIESSCFFRMITQQQLQLWPYRKTIHALDIQLDFCTRMIYPINVALVMALHHAGPAI